MWVCRRHKVKLFTQTDSSLLLTVRQLWQLVPLIHPPTQMANFASRTDEVDGEYLAIVLAISTYTVAFVPNDWLPIAADQLPEFFSRCVGELDGSLQELIAVSNCGPSSSAAD